MSKAFTRDGDEAPDEVDAAAVEHGPALPEGAKNYITPDGHRRLQDELKALVKIERPKVVEVVAWAAGNGDRSENGDYIYGKKRLREIDSRIRFLTKRLEIAEVVDPAAQKNRDQVFFGATVTYATSDDKEHTVTIVGLDEADADHGKVSWIAPVARALLKSRVGDVVELKRPDGVEGIEVVAIVYPEKV
ncbi:MAG: transcription elongation factor GreB [Alphaproteobacteria bacterium]|nr:transcription elongation factor GreB [Alphaproteobacteria bacterium]